MAKIQQLLKQHHQWILSFAVGLSSARLGYDSITSNLIVLIVLGLVGFYVAFKRDSGRWVLWGMLLYLIVPFPMPIVALIAIAMLVVGHFSIVKHYSIVWVGLLAFVVFYATLSPGMLGADAGEFQVVAATWSIAHPPGYPLYTILAGLTAGLLPLGSPAWRVNLVSAIIGALTVLLTAYIVRRETKQDLAGVLSGLALMVASTFWLTSTQASIRPLTTFFVAGMLEGTFAYRIARENQQNGRFALARFGIAAGLGVTHHGSVLFIGLVFALAIVLVDTRNWRQWWIAPVTALIGLVPLIYLPLRDGAFLSPGYLHTLNGIWYHITGKGFARDMFASAAPELWPARWQVAIEIFRLQWHGLILAVGGMGVIFAVWRDRWLGLTLLGGLVVHTFVAVTYRSPQTAEYAIPSYLLLVVLVGWCIGSCTLSQLPRQIVPVVVLVSIGMTFQSGWITMRRLSSVEEARIEAEQALDSASSIILSNWHRVTPLWYLQQVENYKENVSIVYVQGGFADSAMGEWAFAIEDRLSRHESVVVTQYYPESYRFLPLTFENERITRLPSPMPDEASYIYIGDYQLFDELATFPESIRSGRVISVTLTWGVNEAISFGDLTTFIHMGAIDQPPLAQLDLPMQVSEGGAVEIDYDVFVPITVPPGKWVLMAGGYAPQGPQLTEDGDVRSAVGEVIIHPSRFPMPTQHPLRINMGNAHLVGWDYDTTIAHEPMLYLHWYLKEQNQDYTVGVVDRAGAPLSSQMASTNGQPGYWTSTHRLPGGLIEGLQVKLDEYVMRLPKLPIDEHYVLYQDVGALVGWSVRQDDDMLYVNTDWLATGAAFVETNLEIGIGAELTTVTPPITSSVPALKWSFGHVIRSEQSFQLESSEPVEQVSILLVDAFNNRSLFISDTRFGAGVTVVP